MSSAEDIEKQVGQDYEPEAPIARQDVEFDHGVFIPKSELLRPNTAYLFNGYHPAPKRHLGNPVPLGLTGLGVTALVLSLILTEARHVTNYQIVVGSAFVFGGIITAVAGFWCLLIENTFAAVLLTGNGGFFMGFASIFISGFNISTSYTTVSELYDAVGYYLMVWAIFAFLLWLCTFKSTYPTFLFLLLLWVFLACVSISFFIKSTGWKKTGGVFGILASFNGFYIVYVAIANAQTSYIYNPIKDVLLNNRG